MTRIKLKRQKIKFNSSLSRRLGCGLIALLIVSVFITFYLAGKGVVDSNDFFEPCQFQIDHKLPCPTCGMTRAFKAFSTGKILTAFYIQPAAGLLCCLLLAIAVLTLLVTATGINIGVIDYILAYNRWGYAIVICIIILTAGWAVTLARALAQNQ